MAGHSKWAQIKRKKEKQDAKRGRIFTRLAREITVAARQGGGDPEANPRLRSAIASAKAANMPMENIERAIKRGTGELPGVQIEEVTYEGYGPGGVAIIVEAMTDNRNRTTSELRHIFSKHNGNLGTAGCVAWQFETRGMILVSKEGDVDEDELMEVVIDAGAIDLKPAEDGFEVISEPQDLETLRTAIEEAGFKVERAEITKLPKDTLTITDVKKAHQILKLLEAIEEHQDVQNVYTNFDIPDELMAELGEAKG